MSGSTFTWIGGSASAIIPANWSPSGPPGPNTTAIISTGTAILPTDALFTGNTIEIGGTGGTAAALSFTGDSSLNFANPTLDQGTTIDMNVPGQSTAESMLLQASGTFINQGTIAANGHAGSTSTIVVQQATLGTTTLPGFFINYQQLDVSANNALTISVGPNSEFFNAGEIQVIGGSLFFNASSLALAGGYAPGAGAILIAGGGTAETNVGYAPTVTGGAPVYAFGDATAGNTLKIDNIGSFGGDIVGFGANDTIDLGTSLAVTQVSYSSSTGILALENSGSTILASLGLGSGNFINNSFTIGTGGDGDTILTTAVQNHFYNNASGTWQTGTFSNGTPGSLDTALIGLGATSPFTLTTGGTAVAVGALVLASDAAALQITSNMTAGPYASDLFAGTIDVTTGKTLTTPELRMTGGTLQLDPTAVLNLSGHPIAQGVGAKNGTISVQQGDTAALHVFGGNVLVNGGTLNASTASGGNGGHILIGYEGGGTPGQMTVQSSGTNAGVVTDTYALLGSDPTAFGILTLTGNVTWTDAIDTTETTTPTGLMLIGDNGQVGNAPTSPPFSNAATLVVENGATLIDQNSAAIGATTDSSGVATIESGGIWNIGTGGLSVGSLGLATLTVTGAGSKLSDAGVMTIGSAAAGLLQILNGGTVQLAGSKGIIVGASSGSSGTLAISGSGGVSSILNFATSAKGISVGVASGTTGVIDVSSGGTIQMNGTGGIGAGSSLGASGFVTIDGPNALIIEGSKSNGAGIGQGGAGTLLIENGGTFQLNGTAGSAGISAGQTAGAQGVINVTGTNSLLSLTTTNNGMAIGQAGSGTLQVTGGGTVTIAGKGLAIGTSSTGAGMVTVSGTGSSITTQGTNGGISVGTPGTGILNIGNGGVVTASSGVFIATGGTTSGSGIVTVSTGGTLSDGGPLTIGSNGNGTLSVQGGLVQSTGTNGINVGGFSAGSSGLLIINGGTVTDPDSFAVGNTNASGTLQLEAGLLSTTGSFFPSIDATGSGHAVAIVSGGTWNAGSGVSVGVNGTGSLDINSNGLVQTTGTAGLGVGGNSGSSGTLTVENHGTLSLAGGLVVAAPISGSSQGIVTVGDNGTVSLGGLSVGGGGTVTVGGTASPAQLSSSQINIGQTGNGAALVINQFGMVTQTGTSGVSVAFNSGTSGTITVNGGTLNGASGSFNVGGSNATGVVLVENSGLLTGGDGFTIGNGGTATLTVQSGGVVTNTGSISFDIGSFNGGTGSVVVNGGTLANTNGGFFVGNTNAIGTLLVENNGMVITGSPASFADINATGTGSADATVGGATWTSQGQLIVGDDGIGALFINTGGFVNAGTNTIDIGNQSGGNGTISVAGGHLTGGSLFIAQNAGSNGTLSAGGSVSVSSLNIGTTGLVDMIGSTLSDTGSAQNNGTISGSGTLSASLSNANLVAAIDGVLDITGGLSGTGGDQINAGTLEVDGTIAATQAISFVTSSTVEALQVGSLASTTQAFGLSNWQNGDKLIIANGVTVTGATFNNGTLAVTTNGSTLDFTNITLAVGTTPIFTASGDTVTLVSCFAAGTRISTVRGGVAVEDLREGDRLELVHGGRVEPIIWIGHRWVDCRAHPKPHLVWPVHITANAFGAGRPYRDLWLSPDHSVYIGDVLIPIKYLINGTTIRQVPLDEVHYYHVELPRHAVLLAEGLPTESYLDVGDRTNFINGGGAVALYPDFASRIWDAEGCAPVVITGPELEAARRWVNGLAVELPEVIRAA